MTKEDWMSKARQNQKLLTGFILNYHPSIDTFKIDKSLPITAESAESACENVRKSIRQNETLTIPQILERISQAFTSSDVGPLYSLLSSAWFGVPESTSCWRIEGFKEAVDLMDDPPYEGE